MSENYSDLQIDTMLNMYFRNHQRPAPWRQIAEAMGPDIEPKPLERLLWGLITGYRRDGKRRVYTPTFLREDRARWPWYQRETDALQAALSGEGQRRQPPCDIPYIAGVLARRSLSEVSHMWNVIHVDSLGRTGFGLEK